MIVSDRISIPWRNFTTEQLPRQPPSTKEPVVEICADMSKPSCSMWDHHRRQSYLCRRSVLCLLVSFPFFFVFDPSERWPLIGAFVAVGLAGWAASLLVATNQEKLLSSVEKIVVVQICRKRYARAQNDKIAFGPSQLGTGPFRAYSDPCGRMRSSV